MGANPFSSENVDKVRRACHAGAQASTSFGVQALRLLSEIRDNTTPRHDEKLRVFTLQTDGSTSGVRAFTPKEGHDTTLASVTWINSDANGVHVLAGIDVAGAGSGIIGSSRGIETPLFGGVEVRVKGAVGATVTLIVRQKVSRKPSGTPWNVDYRSVDAVGTRPGDHLNDNSDRSAEFRPQPPVDNNRTSGVSHVQ